MSLKIISYNVNGLRAAIKKDLIGWLSAESPDILLLQETKLNGSQIDLSPFHDLGYHTYLHSARKPGYSGVAIFTKPKPDRIVEGCGIEKYDAEGRILRADYGNISVLSAYFPSGSSGDHRQEFKMKFLNDFSAFTAKLLIERPNTIISGDYNICHKEIDIHNPVANKKSSGFLPEERQWITEFLDLGFVDSFRAFHQEPGMYSWWTYRAGARQKNLGWRIDYHMVSKALEPKMQDAQILMQVVHSDHCPVVLYLNN